MAMKSKWAKKKKREKVGDDYPNARDVEKNNN